VPGTAIKGPACRSYGSVDILFLTLGNMGHDLTRRGIVDREGFAWSGFDPLSVDQQFSGSRDELVDFWCYGDFWCYVSLQAVFALEERAAVNYPLINRDRGTQAGERTSPSQKSRSFEGEVLWAPFQTRNMAHMNIHETL